MIEKSHSDFSLGLLQQPLVLDPLLPQHRRVDVDVLAFAIDRDGDGEVLDLELVDRLHAEVGEADDLRPLDRACHQIGGAADRSEEHTSELKSLMRLSYAVFCLKKKKI